MESNPPDVSMPSGKAASTAEAEIMSLSLPLDLAQIREHTRRFENHLTLISDAVASRGIHLDFQVTITSHTAEEILQDILQQAEIPINTVTGVDESAEVLDPMTDSPAIASVDIDQGNPAPHIDENNMVETNANDDRATTEGFPVARPARAQCKICMDELAPETTIMINCGCAYCGTCLNGHIMHGLSSRALYPARCCGAEGIDIGDMQPYLTFDVILRWSEVEAEYKERIPMYCQNKECSAHIPEARLVGEDKFIDCNSCRTDTCKECKQWRFGHGGEDLQVCPEDIVSKEDRELANSEKWKQCPGCKNLVERSDGCNNMLCECDTEFCYDCGVEFSPDHRCGCLTIPDPDGYYHRVGEMPDDAAGDTNPRDTMTEDEFVEMLGNALIRGDRDGHGQFVNAIDAGNWLWEEEEQILWDRLNDHEQRLAFQAYEHIRREHTERPNDPLHGLGTGQNATEERHESHIGNTTPLTTDLDRTD